MECESDVQEALESQACKGERIGEDRYSINFCLAGGLSQAWRPKA